MASDDDAKLQNFLQWLQANGADLRGCTIRPCGRKGFGVFSTAAAATTTTDGVVMVVPLDLAITPMRVLQDPLVGPRLRALFEEDGVDDRLLVMLFLMVERLRPGSLWKPYLDMLPSAFGSSLWFTEDELSELQGTTLYDATMMQRNSLQRLFSDKVKDLVEELLHIDESGSAIDVRYEDFLWANSIFWTRALNISLPYSYVFPGTLGKQENNGNSGGHFPQGPCDLSGQEHASNSEDDLAANDIGHRVLCAHMLFQNGSIGRRHRHIMETGLAMLHQSGVMESGIISKNNGGDEYSKSKNMESIWVEGLVPGIDFCNHDLKALATWEVDSVGNVTGVPASMYLVLADKNSIDTGKEIYINYGSKGNEELLYLYGFVVDNNPDDYLMVHYSVEALRHVESSDRKMKLLEIQKAKLRCLLPRSLLDNGFFSSSSEDDKDNKRSASHSASYSWSGQRKVPSYVHKIVFPQEFVTALRTIAMQEHELDQVSSLLGEVLGSTEDREPSYGEVQSAIWEVCGDIKAFELLVDLLRVKMMELEEGTGTEASDTELLEKFDPEELEDSVSERGNGNTNRTKSKRNYWSSIVYRRGQKQLTRLFLREADHLLELSAKEQT